MRAVSHGAEYAQKKLRVEMARPGIFDNAQAMLLYWKRRRR